MTRRIIARFRRGLHAGGSVRAVAGLLTMLLLLFPLQGAYSQYFGQNKVNYKTFDWYYLQTEHFDIYYPKENYEIAEFCAWTAENALQLIQDSFDYTLTSRVIFLVYPDHNSFQQTNVGGLIDESTGGFTEFLKDRVVIPFDGSYENFRHVIHHELTHAVMLRMLYGDGVQSIISGLSRMPLPLWFIEGLAEYESNYGWSNEADMYIRDAVINDYLMPIDRLGGYFNYKGGQSVLTYIDERYGSKKIAELLHRIKRNRELNRAIKKSLGFDTEELSKRWQKYLKKEIWPSAANYESPDDFAEKLTDHEKWHNFINTSPALSPDGDKMAILSDKDDYMGLFLISTVTGKIERRLVTGQRIYIFEKLLWMRPWVGWSRDSREIAFVAESGPEDALYTFDVNEGKVTRKMKFGLDGIFSPVWAPDGSRIAFAGYKRGESDIYIVELADGSISKVTDDIFSDYDPSWSPDGTRLMFISDRGANLGAPGDDFKMWEYDYRRTDIYMVDLQTGKMSRITNDPYLDRTPAWTPRQDTISFVSDRNGIDNLYLMDLSSGDSWAITDVLTGITQPSWSNSGTIAFASFYNAGYDVYLYKDPFDPDRRKQPQLTAFQKKLREKREAELRRASALKAGRAASAASTVTTPPTRASRGDIQETIESILRRNAIEDSLHSAAVSGSAPEADSTALIAETQPDSTSTDTSATEEKPPPIGRGVRFIPDDEPGEITRVRNNPYSNYVFTPDNMNREWKRQQPDSTKKGPLIGEDGKFIPQKYKLKFSPDIVNAAAGYSTFFGLQGMGQVMFSDVLGDHLIFLSTDLYYSFENSNFSLYYYNLPHRSDYGGGIFHNVYFFDYGWIRDRNYGFSFEYLYPMSRYRRIGFSGAFVNIDRDVWDPIKIDYSLLERRHFVLPTVSYVFDNTLWGYTGPMNGRRYRVAFSYSPILGSGGSADNLWGIDFRTLSADYRRYFHVGRDYVFALRGAGAASWGKQPQRFFLGGVNNWINRRFAGGDIRVNIDEIYFSGFATPLRGADYYEKDGTRYLLFNGEFRFPLVRQLLFGWPLPLFFNNIRGVAFYDLGAAWYGNDFKVIDDPPDGPARFRDVALGYGWGARLNLGVFLLKWDMAWANDWHGNSKPRYYLSLGTDF